MKKKILFLCLLSGFQLVCAQQDQIQLEEAKITDRLLKYSHTQNQETLKDSILERNGQTLTELLNFNSLIYFKENGPGMVSSPSFRGTSASHTAVIWNGININSAFLGQMDFNTLGGLNFDQLTLKSGGGSVAYGSSAIGGSVHLNNEIRFNQGFQNQILAHYGSVDSYGFHAKSSYSDSNLSLSVQLGRNGSDNDFEIPSLNRKNLNGQFYNNQLGIQAAYKFNSKNQLKFLGNLVDGERHFSLIAPNALPTKYKDYNTRSMLEWDAKWRKFHSVLQMVYLGEEFNYFPNTQSDLYEFGNGRTYLLKYNLGYQIRNLYFHALLDFSHAEVESSKIDFAKRQIGSLGVLMKHQVAEKFFYEASIRQELTDAYEAPLLYSLGINWSPTSFYHLNFHTSKNFRMPTFNDLYWPGGGNENLNPETSYQVELGNRLAYRNWTLKLIGYHNSISNFIQWIPVGGTSTPENVGKVKIYGFESILNYHKKFNQQQIELNASYAYTQSQNDLTGKQLIYVPFHKGTASIGYSWKRISAYYQWMYNGKVFIDSGNTDELDAYHLSNLGLEFGWGKHRNYKIGFQALNLWDEAYQNVENRPMLGRNFKTYINIKF